VTAVRTYNVSRDVAAWQITVFGGLLLSLFAGFGAAYGGAPWLGLPLMFGPPVAVAVALQRRDDILAGPRWRYKGVPLSDTALDMLEDVQARFDYAHRLIDEVPTGIDWHEVSEDVAVLMWECVEHGARVSALDAELEDMKYSAANTPQAALQKQLADRRQEHWQMLLHNQREADTLARAAGNAAAAAKVALTRTGSLRALEVAAPTGRGILARSALAEARARLALLADVWTELDESTDLLSEQLGLNEAHTNPDGPNL
jgi:hypothetical protein